MVELGEIKCILLVCAQDYTKQADFVFALVTLRSPSCATCDFVNKAKKLHR